MTRSAGVVKVKDGACSVPAYEKPLKIKNAGRVATKCYTNPIKLSVDDAQHPRHSNTLSIHYVYVVTDFVFISTYTFTPPDSDLNALFLYLAPEILNYEPITTATDLWYVCKVFS